MASRKKKTLPKDFEDLLQAGDIGALKAVFDNCDVNARGGVFKQTALAFNECPDALARWLVQNSADISAPDSYGETPLHARAGHWQGRIEILLELGADLHHGENARGTPLRRAAGCYNVDTARVLIEHGARVDAGNSAGQTPLAFALARCNNADIERMSSLAALLLEAGASVSLEAKAQVARIGANFEFHRAGFNPETVDAASAALDALYRLFDVTPAPRRKTHNGEAPIVSYAAGWERQFEELWALLVPSSGAAETVQGEVIRITGRIRDEWLRNGGTNWDADYKKMADAFLAHICSGAAISGDERAEAVSLIADVKKGTGDMDRLCALGVRWVALNPLPTKLPAPDYRR